MKKQTATIRGFVLGILVTILLSGTIVIASPVARDLFFGVNVTVNGENMDFADDSQPFIIDGRVFLPVGAMANAFGFEATWNEATTTANITFTEAEECEEAPTVNPITAAEIAALQTAWGQGLVAISTAYAAGEDYATIAQGVLDTLYGYVDGAVLFKPTVAQEVPFRFTEASAASYFIGGSISEDTGFALNPWTAVRFCNEGLHIINGETALWMGSVYLTNGDGEEIRVEKSLGLYRDSDGDVRIQLHHSSVPFSE